MEHNLKPCPFCGGKAMCWSRMISGIEREWVVKCNRCKANVGLYTTEKAAKTAWNRRTNDGT